MEPSKLIAALEKATLMAKQLPNTRDPSQIREIYASLHSTHHQFTMFLAYQSTPLPQPSLLFPAATIPAPQNSVFSTGDETPVEDCDDGVTERNTEFFIQNKRLKRSISPSAVTEEGRIFENEGIGGGSVAEEFEHQRTKLRSLDLVYQFHD